MNALELLGLLSALITVASLGLYRQHLPNARLAEMEKASASVDQRLTDAYESGQAAALTYFRAEYDA